jgi:hypothetical protein
MHLRNRQPPKSLNLSNKALIVVSVPIVYQVITMAVVLVLIQQSAQGAPDTVSRIKVWLVLGMILNVLLTVSFAKLFARGLSSRLSVICDNVVRLASRARLSEPLSGNDEVAQLDRVIHRFAEALEQERASHDANAL